ncbi:MAG: hypothetical protein K2L01_08415 [Rikenellaceae bacterium]|nr:hypothetical protein [Rikenellaceae bacterium]
MKELSVERIARPLSHDEAAALLDEATAHRIACVNWPDSYPYMPEVAFSVLHDGDTIYLRYTVEESSVAAVAPHDNGQVWLDSCVEMFCSFDGSGYYNLEANAAGQVLLSYRVPGGDKVMADSSVLAAVGRYPSLGREPFAERVGQTRWSLMLTIPKEAFFRNGIESLCGAEATANFYKCGDNLQTPHFVSWSPIDNPKPNFHLPQYFGKVRFM